MRVKFDVGIGSECPHCKIGVLDLKRGKFGDFYGCSRFPYCAFSQSVDEEDEELDDFNERPEDNDLVFK